MRTVRDEVVIIGAGLTGCVLTNLISRDCHVTLVEKSHQIGGLCADRKTPLGWLQEFGGHLFHTNNEKVYQYVRRFCRLNAYIHRAESYTNGQLYCWPPNLKTLEMLYPSVEEAKRELRQDAQTPGHTFEAEAIRRVGRRVYEALVKGYSEKMWGEHLTGLDASVARRFGLKMSYDSRYYQDRYQGVPVNGYTMMMGAMVAEYPRNVRVMYDTKVTVKSPIDADIVINTSPIDAFYHYKFGRLEYRSMGFQRVPLLAYGAQVSGTVNLPSLEIEALRVENHDLYYQSGNYPFSSLYLSFPCDHNQRNVPMYPVPTRRNRDLARKYLEMSRGVIHAGRLGTYQYLNMDQAIAQAIQLYEEIAGEVIS